MKLYIIILGVIFVINFIGFITVWRDKRKAVKEKWRIPEKRFFTIALMGGALGVYIGMEQFRHKTQHPKFIYGIPAMIGLNLVLFYLLFFKGLKVIV